MTEDDIKKCSNSEHPIPLVWREKLKLIADSFVDESFPPSNIIDNICNIDGEVIKQNYEYISDYPDQIGSLNDITWETSICTWQDGYWLVLIDLSQDNGVSSDLVFHAKIYESSSGFIFEPGLIFVP